MIDNRKINRDESLTCSVNMNAKYTESNDMKNLNKNSQKLSKRSIDTDTLNDSVENINLEDKDMQNIFVNMLNTQSINDNQINYLLEPKSNTIKSNISPIN